jgi:ABC-type transport system substrate-binding protein
MKPNGYWANILCTRVSRRRAFVASGATALGAAFLAACGGVSNGGGETEHASGLLTQPVDTSKQAVRGGTMKTYSRAFITHYDVHNTQTAGQGIPDLAYSRFVVTEPGYLGPVDYFKVKADMGESWEYSPDGLTLTMKLRQGAGWAPLAPVNGRPVDIEDIAYTWKRWAEKGSNRVDHLNSLNPDAPVLSFATTDARTFVWKLARPTTTFLPMLAGGPKTPYIIPKESADYDLRTVPIGSGPHYVASQVSDAGWTLKRNPNFYDKQRPYIETIERPVIPEYAAVEAQFRTGGIYDFPEMRQEQALKMKADVPNLKMYAIPPDAPGLAIYFGWKPNPPGKTPFRDVRVRQAFSRTWDRDQWIDVFYNVSDFKAAGIPIETRWNTCMVAKFDGWWLDPKSKDFGPNAANFQRDIAEAKKLLTAAGYANGLEVDSVWPPTGIALDLGKWVTTLEGMSHEAGFRFNTLNPNFGTEYLLKYRDANGNYEGMVWRNQGLVGGDPLNQLTSEYLSTPGNIRFSGFDPAGKGDFSGDPALEAMIKKASSEFDANKQVTQVHEIQRYMGKMLFDLYFPGSASGLELVWPAVQNQRVFNDGRSITSRGFTYQWIDQTKPPIQKA